MLNRVVCTVERVRRGRGAAQRLQLASGVPLAGAGRVLRLARLMALAVQLEAMLGPGNLRHAADLARLAQVSRARISQVLGLLHLAPDIQEELLLWPRITSGREPLVLGDLQPIIHVPDWVRQRKLWHKLKKGRGMANAGQGVGGQGTGSKGRG
jgi:hypothetical protein